MDLSKLARELSKGEPAATYLLTGEEDALVDRALQMITDRILSKSAAADFSLTRLDGKTCDASELDAAARTASLFGGRRLVILRAAQSMRPAEQKKVIAYLKKPVPSTSLVLIVRGAGPSSRDPKRSKAAKAARAYKKAVEAGGGRTVDCPRPSARDLPRMAESALSDAGLSIDREGLHALVDAIGEDLGALWQAVEKLALFKAGQGRVKVDDVAEVVADTRTQSVFALTDAVAEGKLDRALGGLRRLIRDGDSPLTILGHLSRHFRILARVQALAVRGDSADTIRSALGLHPFVVKKSIQQSRRFRPGSLARKLGRLAEADRSLKGGAMPDALELELLVGALCAS